MRGKKVKELKRKATALIGKAPNSYIFRRIKKNYVRGISKLIEKL